uniref:Uncharacterized protein n=1 Tax=Lactuca sativa TaxID=4236 RepID=A0A9R1W2N5_LACSA|nr:hypothetical protein LSAT_V11C300148380 [Lactuca sativa]
MVGGDLSSYEQVEEDIDSVGQAGDGSGMNEGDTRRGTRDIAATLLLMPPTIGSPLVPSPLLSLYRPDMTRDTPPFPCSIWPSHMSSMLYTIIGLHHKQSPAASIAKRPSPIYIVNLTAYVLSYPHLSLKLKYGPPILLYSFSLSNIVISSLVPTMTNHAAVLNLRSATAVLINGGCHLISLWTNHSYFSSMFNEKSKGELEVKDSVGDPFDLYLDPPQYHTYSKGVEVVILVPMS